jgi:hypothetical protein
LEQAAQQRRALLAQALLPQPPLGLLGWQQVPQLVARWALQQWKQADMQMSDKQQADMRMSENNRWLWF